MHGIAVSRGAERDLRRIGPGEALARIRVALEGLSGGASDLDIKPLVGAAPWHRLRVGDYRILYRAVEASESADNDTRWLVARIVHRRELERAVSTLT